MEMLSIIDNPGRFSILRGLRAYRDMFRFTGRARRLEVAEFYIVSGALTAATGFVLTSLNIDAGSPAESFLATRIALETIQLLLMLPIIALTARRVQDFDLPGWPLAPLMIYVMAINAWKAIAVVTYAYPRSLWKSLAFLVPGGMPSGIWELLTIPIALALFAAWLAPGTIGPNRYGPDPREGSPVTV